MTDPTDPPAEELSRLRDRPPGPRLLVCALAAVAGVYLAGVSARWWPTPDSALIMGLSRSLAEGQGYRFNGRPNTVIPPGLPVQLAVVRRIAGDGEWAANLFVALTALASLAVIFSVLSRLADRRTALAVVLCTGLSHVFYEHAHRVLTDVPFVLLFWLVMWYWVSWGRWVKAPPPKQPVGPKAGTAVTLLTVCLLVVAGVAVRFPGVVAFGIFAGAVLIDSRTLGGLARRIALSAVVLASTVAAVVAYRAFTRYIAGNDPRYIERVGHALPAGFGDALARLGQGLAVMPETVVEVFTAQAGLALAIAVGVPLLALIAIGAVCLWRGRRRAIVVLALAYPVALTLCTGHGNFRPRYLMPVTPLLFWLALEGVWAAPRWAARRRGGPAPAAPAAQGAVTSRRYLVAATVFTVAVIAVNAPRVAREAFYYSLLSRTDRYDRVTGQAETVKVAGLIARNIPPGVGVFVRNNRHSILHYLTRRELTPFPRKHPRQTAADADDLIGRVRDAAPAFVLLHHDNDDGEAFTRRMRQAFDTGAYVPVYAGKEYRLYAPRLGAARTKPS